ncbi:MAG: hypothetical protein H6679_02565 [Epsilonproteobacteria bacterium]|nr:hypothetical protein [Campylobacterota bacterium]
MNFAQALTLYLLVYGTLLASQVSAENRPEQQQLTEKNNGIVIILNGSSAVGKSSIQRVLQETFTDDPFLAMGIDKCFVELLPKRYITTIAKKNKEVIWGRPSMDEEGNPLFYVDFGPKGRKIILGMNSAIAAYVRRGNSVIVDYIAYEHAWLDDLVRELHDCTVYFVAVKADIAVIEKREADRGISPRGHARTHYQTVHENAIYDFEVDNTELTPEQAAEQIKAFIDQTPEPQAFKMMYTRLAEREASVVPAA